MSECKCVWASVRVIARRLCTCVGIFVSVDTYLYVERRSVRGTPIPSTPISQDLKESGVLQRKAKDIQRFSFIKY